MPEHKCEVAIVGAGLSGLHTAYKLAQAGIDCRLIEAKPRVGGRIYTETITSELGSTCFDLGPSWFWPGQENIQRLITELNLELSVFQQYSQGDALYQPPNAATQRGVGGISMQGSYRIDGGLSKVTDALAKRFSDLSAKHSLTTSTCVNAISLAAQSVEIQTDTGESIYADKVIIALPPRVALQTIAFTPQLHDDRTEALNNVATWMAAQAKVVAVYDNAFWREAGLSGDVISHRGPLAEIHDASSRDANLHALFGFLATPPRDRLRQRDALHEEVVTQLVALFGEAASSPKTILYKNWASDNLVATSYDQSIATHYQSNVWSSRMDWQGRLIWSGTESAAGRFNGYIEGALVASEHALSLIKA